MSANDLLFQIHPRIFDALGGELVTNDLVAVMELVKNSYDAFASAVTVSFEVDAAQGSSITILDNGSGMTRDVIQHVWCVVGTPFKKDNPFSNKGSRRRRVSGEKGLGRLSAARLGSQLELITKTSDGKCVKVDADWASLSSAETFDQCKVQIESFDGATIPYKSGTLLRMKGLLADWNPEKIAGLKDNLARFISPFGEFKSRDFSILMRGPDSEAAVEVEPADFLEHPPYLIKGEIDGYGNASVSYRYQGPKNQHRKSVKTQRLELLADIDDHENELGLDVKPNAACGPFRFEIRAWDIGSEAIEELADRLNLSKAKVRENMRAHAGISLYRDHVLVLPKSERVRDWLGLDLRRVSRVGKRLGTSQIIGYVAVSAESNPDLIDTSDRERLKENTASKEFQRLIKQIVEILEDEREKDRVAVGHKEPAFKELFSALSPKPLIERIEKLAEEGAPARDVIPALEEFGDQVDDTVEQIERRFVYYSRLASLGSIAAMVIHEVRNNTVVIGRLIGSVLKAIENKIIQDPTVEKFAPLANHATTSLDELADSFAPLASRTLMKRNKTSMLKDIATKVLHMREQDISQGQIAVDCTALQNVELAINPGELSALILNVTDNAIYWLTTIKDRRISFKSRPASKNGRVKIEIHDSGPGIATGDEERIFWPGFTRRPQGIGMGLTVAAEIVAQYGGKMFLLQPGELGGASFGFDLPAAGVKR